MTPLEGMRLFPEFRGESWAAWGRILARLTSAVREFYAIVGRGAGKSRIVALLACAFALRDYPRVSGESIYIGIFAPDKKQAAITFRYVLGLLRSVEATAALIVTARRESIDLSNGLIIEVLSSTIAAPRGRAYALAIVEEAAFLPQDQSANPDQELLRSLRPALARVPGSLLAVVSSPYARRGVLWKAWQRYHGQPDGDVVLVQASTLELNPTFDARAVAQAYDEDPASASAEYGATWRSDIESFLSVETITACVVAGRRALPPVPGVEYVAFVDAASGSGRDSFTLAIAHAAVRPNGQVIAVLDVLAEARPPFSPEDTVGAFAATIKTYLGASPFVRGDRWGGAFVQEAFSKQGVTYWTSERVTSDVYREVLPWLTSGRAEFLDHPRLIAQLTGLERSAGRSGRDVISHPPMGHDDLCTAALGVALEVLTQPLVGEGGQTLTHFDPFLEAGLERHRLYDAALSGSRRQFRVDGSEKFPYSSNEPWVEPALPLPELPPVPLKTEFDPFDS